MMVLLSGLVGSHEDKAKGSDPAIHTTPLEALSFSFEPAAFADSPLRHSIIEKEMQEKEIAGHKAAAKQNEADQRENAIYLTFDDGPSSVSTQLLDILDEYKMKATFFMLGPNMERYPKAVKRMHQDGYGLALHGISHSAKKIYSSPAAPVEEMAKDQEILENLTGVHTKLIRLPYGSIPYLTEDMRYLLDQNDFNIWDWNVDSRDWELRSKRYVQHTIYEIQQMEHSGETPIILLHDIPKTVQYLPELLSYIKKQGYKTKVLTNDIPPVTFPCKGRCHPIN